MQEFYLIDVTHDKKGIDQLMVYDAFSRACLKYGCIGQGGFIPEKYIREFWSYDEQFPSTWTIKKWIRISSVKWYIHNVLESTVEVWNSNFLHGIALNGKLMWGKSRFPSFAWSGKSRIKELIESCPFGGYRSSNWDRPVSSGVRYRWMYVPAFYLKFDSSSPSFMAGALMGGKVVHKEGKNYVRYVGNVIKFLKKWGIPIEYESPKGNVALISPIWPALLSPRVPEQYRDVWLNIENAAGVDLYSSILWRTYIGNDFVPDGIPYLKSRRWIYYNLKEPEESLMTFLDIQRIKTGLINLNNNFRDVIHEWNEKAGENNEVLID